MEGTFLFGQKNFKAKMVFASAAAGLLLAMQPGLVRADTTYTYTGVTTTTLNGSGNMSITLSLSLTGAALDNIAPGTNVSGSVTSFSMTDGGPPPQDTAGFPNADFSLSGPGVAGRVVQIGTDSVGNITSWNISQGYFISFPAFSGENPDDFYGDYNIVSTTTGDQTVLTTDNDAGFSPGSSSLASPGTWSPTFAAATPEPASLSLLGLGLAGLVARRRRRA